MLIRIIQAQLSVRTKTSVPMIISGTLINSLVFSGSSYLAEKLRSKYHDLAVICLD